MDVETERGLIERVRRGDRAAAGELVRAHQGALYGYLLRVCGRAEMAEDAAQEAFVRALTHIDRFDGRHRFSTWVFAIARRVLLTAMAKRRPLASEGLDGVAARPGSLTLADEAEGVRAALQKALLALSVEQREAVVLFHHVSWPVATIAAHMGLPENTVKSHLHRGRRRLREELERRGFGAWVLDGVSGGTAEAGA